MADICIDIISVSGDGFYMFGTPGPALWASAHYQKPFLQIVYVLPIAVALIRMGGSLQLSVVAHMSVPVPRTSDWTRANAGTWASRPIALMTATAPSRARFFISVSPVIRLVTPVPTRTRGSFAPVRPIVPE